MSEARFFECRIYDGQELIESDKFPNLDEAEDHGTWVCGRHPQTRFEVVSRSRVELIDARRPSSHWNESEGGRWITFCRLHHSAVQHETVRAAEEWLLHPEEWCEGCQAEEVSP